MISLFLASAVVGGWSYDLACTDSRNRPKAVVPAIAEPRPHLPVDPPALGRIPAPNPRMADALGQWHEWPIESELRQWIDERNRSIAANQPAYSYGSSCQVNADGSTSCGPARRGLFGFWRSR